MQVGETKWSEVRDLEELLHQFHHNLNFTDAPVECAVLFHDRLDKFLKEYVLGGENLLGKIDHNVNRLENQVSLILRIYRVYTCSFSDLLHDIHGHLHPMQNFSTFKLAG